MTTPPQIAHAIGWADTLTETNPTSLSDAHDWISDARTALETSADLIEALALERDALRDRAHTGEILLDHLYPYLERNLVHIQDCDADEHDYPDVIWMAGGCRACETLALARHWFNQTTPLLTEREIETVLANTRYL